MGRFAMLGVVLISACVEEEIPIPNVYCDQQQYFCNDPANPICDIATHLCGPIPDAGTDLAMCAASAACPDATPICAGMCRACSSNADDAACAARSAAAPRCDSSTGKCVACRADTQATDCAAATPICDQGACRKCAAHAECASLICNADGSCATDVAYVDNQNGACTGTHSGTINDPYCDIQTALNSKSNIHVTASNTAYSSFTVSNGTIVIVGPSARITGGAGPAVSVTGGSLLLDGVEVTGAFAGQTGVYCAAAVLGPTLTVLRSNIHDLAGVGISTNNCKLILDRDAIGPGNSGGGISITGTQYAITNCFIVGNGAAGPGVTIGLGSSELAGGPGFAHDTVAKNVTLAGVAGLACNAGITAITNTIVWGNDTGGSGTCNFVHTVTTGNPDFVNATGPAFDFHLAGRTTANDACCIDQLTTSPVDHDFDGRLRPQNVKWDIGAHEVP